jgi:hypothetical protein
MELSAKGVLTVVGCHCGPARGPEITGLTSFVTNLFTRNHPFLHWGHAMSASGTIPAAAIPATAQVPFP